MRITALVLLVLVLSSFRLLPSRDGDVQIMKAAEGQLDIFLAKIPPGDEVAYGFADAQEMENCTIGKPFRILEFSNDFFQQPVNLDNSHIVFRNEWRVPVMSSGKSRVLLKMTGTPGNYLVTGMGNPDLARELQLRTNAVNAEDNYYLLRIFPLLAEFFVHEGTNSLADAEFIPLASAREALPTLAAGRTAYTLWEVQDAVKATLKKERPASEQPQPAKPKKKPMHR